MSGALLSRVAAALTAGGVACLLTACGGSGGDGAVDASAAGARAQVQAQTSTTPPPSPNQATIVKTTPSGTVTLPRDSEESDSFPLPEGERGTKDAAPPSAVPQEQPVANRDGGASDISPGAPSDEEIRRELKQMDQAVAQAKAAAKSGGKLDLGADGLARVPAGAPEEIARLISGANAISHFPYVYGGGHGSFVDSAYDCSGSLSYALAAAGLLKRTMTSGELAGWGEPGQGKWITIFANETHTFMYVGGLRYDTSGRSGPLGSRWQTAPRSMAGFTVRHPPGF